MVLLTCLIVTLMAVVGENLWCMMSVGETSAIETRKRGIYDGCCEVCEGVSAYVRYSF